LRVDFKDNYFTVTFDGKQAFGWNDATFKDAGKVGVWTKADSTTLFDDFTYGPEARITKADMDGIDKDPKKNKSPEADDDTTKSE